ncbi:alpha-D-ribose 1-methylphosphonate 5-triphosphate diphosphatase [Paenibacillus yanchengensis]|uniref:Alpha-D-ribose 1-methylphosphonate 5-triphosphate diphosphatase n=1 Tax=Paenibacillus yanchengensis TaxID=2035833 RepID=A0ABW4YFP9_9BACL
MEIEYNEVTLIINGQLVLAEEIVQVALAIHNGIIIEIFDSTEEMMRWKEQFTVNFAQKLQIIDAQGQYVLPGMIDIHCDTIEKEVEPRPNTLFPLPFAFMEFERKLPLYGITTMYHSLSLGVGLSLRGEDKLAQMVEWINTYRKQRAMVRNRIHLRYEVSHLTGMKLAKQYIETNKIDFLSFMDHSPGQGQYRKPDSFERYVMKNQGVTRDEVGAIVAELQERRTQVDWKALQELAQAAKNKGIAIASHDDDTQEQVDKSISRGAIISEFPIDLQTAQYATEQGMYICVGAPNIVRGGSHDLNLRATDAIKQHAAHIICSDYHPSSLLAAVFKLADEQVLSLPAAVKMVSLHPAAAMGIAEKCGSIAVGKYADLLFVDRYEQIPWITTTIVGGKMVYQTNPSEQAIGNY